MKLAYICTDRNLAVFGNSGRAAYIQEVLRALIARGVQVDLFAARLDGDRPEGLRSLIVHKLSLFGTDLMSEDTALLRANRELRRLLDGARGGSFGLVLERFSPWSYAGMEYATMRKIPGVLETTDTGIEELQRLPQEAEKMARETLNTATTILSGSPLVAAELKARGLDAVRLPGQLDPERYSNGARLTIRKTGAFTIGYTGELDCPQSLKTLMEAFTLLHRKHAEARLLVEGEGAAKAEMIAELSRRGLLGTTCFLGKVPARRMATVLAAMDLTVVFRNYQFRQLQDSMIAGVPVVSCTSTLVRDGVNGLVCPENDVPALCSAFEKLYTDRILRLRLGSNARRSLLNDQIWDQIARCILEQSHSIFAQAG